MCDRILVFKFKNFKKFYSPVPLHCIAFIAFVSVKAGGWVVKVVLKKESLPDTNTRRAFGKIQVYK